MPFKYIYAVVEGPTEENFIKHILNKYMENFFINIHPILIETSKTPRKSHKGGLTTYSHLKKDILKLLNQSQVYKVSTIIDYYGLPDDFPGIDSLPNGDIYKKVEHLESEFFKDINHPKFIPFIQIHEFEALLFSSIDGFKAIIYDEDKIEKFQIIINSFPNPEEINDGIETHPSKRIEKIYPEYNKVKDCVDIISHIGIEIILEKCRHFSKWIESLKDDGR